MLFIFPCFLKIPVIVFDKQIFARYKPDLFLFFRWGIFNQQVNSPNLHEASCHHILSPVCVILCITFENLARDERYKGQHFC